jgi:hypothetical protein
MNALSQVERVAVAVRTGLSRTEHSKQDSNDGELDTGVRRLRTKNGVQPPWLRCVTGGFRKCAQVLTARGDRDRRPVRSRPSGHPGAAGHRGRGRRRVRRGTQARIRERCPEVAERPSVTAPTSESRMPAAGVTPIKSVRSPRWSAGIRRGRSDDEQWLFAYLPTSFGGIDGFRRTFILLRLTPLGAGQVVTLRGESGSRLALLAACGHWSRSGTIVRAVAKRWDVEV